MNVYVICCNEAIKYCVLKDENRANEVMEDLKEAYFEENSGAFRNRHEYEARCRWYVYAVTGE